MNSPIPPTNPGDSIEALLNASHPKIKEYVAALKAENAKLQRQIVKMEAEKISYQNRLAAVEDELGYHRSLQEAAPEIIQSWIDYTKAQRKEGHA